MSGCEIHFGDTPGHNITGAGTEASPIIVTDTCPTGMRRLPTIASPANCTPPPPPCPSLANYIEDEYGTGWEWAPGGPWVKTQKARCGINVTTPIVAPVNYFFTVDGLGNDNEFFDIPGTETCVDIINPTCDDFVFDLDLRHHAQPQTHESEPALQVWFQTMWSIGGTYSEGYHKAVSSLAAGIQIHDTSNGSQFGIQSFVVAAKQTVPLCVKARTRWALNQPTDPRTGVRGATVFATAHGSAEC